MPRRRAIAKIEIRKDKVVVIQRKRVVMSYEFHSYDAARDLVDTLNAPRDRAALDEANAFMNRLLGEI
jgi:hypothetical protein